MISCLSQRQCKGRYNFLYHQIFGELFYTAGAFLTLQGDFFALLRKFFPNFFGGSGFFRTFATVKHHSTVLYQGR